MATSGATAFAPTLVDIFEEAYERATGDELRYGYQIRSIRRSLNLLLLDWQNRGYNLWQLADSVTFALPGEKDVPLADNCVDTIEVMVGDIAEQTVTTGAIDAAATTVVISAPLSPQEAFTLRVGAEAMSVVSGFGTTTLTVTRAAGSVSHDVGSPAFVPTSAITEQAIERRSVPDYAAIANKSTRGRPSTMLVRRESSPVTLTVWPVPDRVYAMSYYYLRRVEDAGNGGNHPDVPMRFIPAMIAGLAFYVAQKNPAAGALIPMLEQSYEKALAAAQSEDREKATLVVVPIRGYQRR